MLLGNKQYNLFLPCFFPCRNGQKNDPEAAFIYSKDLLSERADLMTLNCFLRQIKDALSLTQGQEPKDHRVKFSFNTFTYHCGKKY